MNMSVENNMLYFLCQTNYKGLTHAFQIFSKLLQNSYITNCKQNQSHAGYFLLTIRHHMLS